MTLICKLTRGLYALDLNDKILYWVAEDFLPPSVSLSQNIAHGTSANRYGGGELVSEKAGLRQFSFGLHLFEGSDSQIRAAIAAVDTFIRSGTEDEPVYLEVRQNADVAAEPLWGVYGCNLRYKVITGQATAATAHAFGGYPSRNPEAHVVLTISPFAETKRIRMAQARGYVIQNNIAGVDRGVVLGTNKTNHFSNPVFGNRTDWDTNWTVSGSLIAEENLDQEFILFDRASAKLSNLATDLDWGIQEEIDVGTTSPIQIGCYVRRPDGGQVTSADGYLGYPTITEITTTYQHIGRGWYLLTGEADGVEEATPAALFVRTGKCLYADAFFAIVKSNGQQFFYGDQLGASWAGTAHASKSTIGSDNNILRIPGSEAYNITGGTFLFAIEPIFNVDSVILDSDSTASLLSLTDLDRVLAIHQLPASGGLVVEFKDGTNTAQSSPLPAQEIGVVTVIHAVYSDAGLSLYINGALDGTDDYEPPAAAQDWLYIGSDESGAARAPYNYRIVATYNRPLTATEIADDYANLSAALEDGYVAPIPYVWTIDGDGVVDAINDADQKPYCVAGGIPGTLPADTILHVQNSADGRALILANNPHYTYIDMDDTFLDRQGTAVAGAFNGEAERVSTDTTEDDIPASTRISIADLSRAAYYNKPAHIFVSLADAGSLLRARLKINFTSDLVLAGEYQSLAADGTLRQFLIGPVNVPYGPEGQFEWAGVSSTLNFYAGFVRSSGAAANVDFDYYQLLIGQVAYIVPAGANTREYVLREGRAWGFNVNATQQRETPQYRGTPIRFEPGMLNHLVILSGAVAAATSLTVTSTIVRAYLVPRYALI